MSTDVSSRQIRSAAELLFRAPVKQGFVPIPDTLSYASRLRILLRALYKERRRSAEADLYYGAGPIERLQGLFNSQWTVTDDDQFLIVTVSFDHSWQDYVERLAREAGPMLDLIFCGCEDYARFACVGPGMRLRYQGLSEWIRQNQLPIDFYYPTAPDVTVDDIRYMRKLAIQRRPGITASARVRVGRPGSEIADGEDPQARDDRTQSSLRKLKPLRPLFPERISDDTTDPLIFDVAARNLFQDVAKLPPGQDDWIEEIRHYVPAPAAAQGPARLDEAAESDIQGNILEPYGKMTHGCLVLARFESHATARALLGHLEAKVATQATPHDTEGPFTNFAITYRGLQRLGVDDGTLGRFPQEFREGMSARSGTLGDLGDNHPVNWRRPVSNWPRPDTPVDPEQRVDLSVVDCVIEIEGRSNEPHSWEEHPLRAEVEALEASGAQILHVQILQRKFDGEWVREHFGFVDGVSQPIADVMFHDGRRPAADVPERHVVPLGEILLGTPDVRGEVQRCADPALNPDSYPLFQNGSFLVVRKLEQHVEEFRKWAGDDAERVVGRRDDGRTLEGHPPNDNDFDFDGDEDGRTCPLHAHVRLANPRTGNETGNPVPRIVRRGFSYGPRIEEDAEQERGLVFMAYNASIAQQYEVIQRWLNGGNVTGIRSGQHDLLTGPFLPASGPHFVHRGTRWAMLRAPKQAFTTLHWGLYAFAPSRAGIRWLRHNVGSDGAAALRGAALLRRGRLLVDRLRRLEVEHGPAEARDGWKSIIEEPRKRADAVALWTAVRDGGGVLDTPYGVLVGSASNAATVLGDDGQRFSVREYWHRLRRSTGEHYISFDPSPRQLRVGDPTEDEKHRLYEERLDAGGYAEHADIPNDLLEQEFGSPDPVRRDAAKQVAHVAIDKLIDESGDGLLELRSFASRPVAFFAKEWFGVEPSTLGSVVEASRYSFQPWPEKVFEEIVDTLPAVRLHEAPICPHLRGQGIAEAEIAKVQVGSAVGFAAPAIGCIVTVLMRWIQSEELWVRAEAWARDDRAGRWESLLMAIVRTLVATPVPPLLYRTAVEQTRLGGVDVTPGRIVVVGLGSVAMENPAQSVDWLFGGARTTNPHGCPGRHAALDVVAGAIAAVLERSNLRYREAMKLEAGGRRADA